jgi:diguanylate cyclase (GGDEF)-like protein
MLSLVKSNVLELEQLIHERNLRTFFQPVVSLSDAAILGFEGLTRGQAEAGFESPLALFGAATEAGLESTLDRNCRRAATVRFAERKLEGKLFLNVLASSLADVDTPRFAVTSFLDRLALRPDQIVIEITESQPITNFAGIKKSLTTLRSLGFQIAIDDLGEAYASLKLWLELRPDYVKIDKVFVKGLQTDGFKQQFVRAIQQIGESTASLVIAEGVETEAELTAIRDLGIPYAQGYFLGRPTEHPNTEPSATVAAILSSSRIAVLNQVPAPQAYANNIGKLVLALEPTSPITNNEVIMARFTMDPNLASIPVVVDGVPVGMIRRARFIQEFARPFRHELYDKRPCSLFMDTDPMIVEASLSVRAVSELLTEADRRPLASGFIITEQKRYLGIGTGQALLRELTELQVNTARYANPLTLLPGNVPIDEHVERLLGARTPFIAAYCDIDFFKPFNDLYGYRKGDEMISGLAQALVGNVDHAYDFVGHVGGDDFILHLQSADWEDRLRRIHTQFEVVCQKLLREDDLTRGRYLAEARDGHQSELPTPTISIGAVQVNVGMFRSAQDVAAALTVAKREAKKLPGNSLFIERRRQQLDDASPQR